MSEEGAVALLVTLGTTAQPVERVMEGITRTLVLYGRPFPGQQNNPVDQLLRLREYATAHGIALESWEVADPEDLAVTLETCRAALQYLTGRRPAMIIADFTGGTKVMSAALCHAVLTTPLDVPVQLQYVGGERRGKDGRVITEGMQLRTQVEALQAEMRAAVLDHLRRFDYAGAEALGGSLLGSGRNAFVRSAAVALQQWDRFEYQDAADQLRRGSLGGGMAAAFAGDDQLGRLADTLGRLHHAVDPMTRAARFLRSLDNRPAPEKGVLAQHHEGIVLLVADVLENAARRHGEGREADALLRCYRTVETAIQAALLADGTNPWGKEKIALNQGYEVLAPKVGLAEDLVERVRELQQVRNYSFLEHGYGSVTSGQADRALETADRVAGALLAWAVPGADLASARSRVTHRV